MHSWLLLLCIIICDWYLISYQHSLQSTFNNHGATQIAMRPWVCCSILVLFVGILKRGEGWHAPPPPHTFCCIISHELANRPFGRCRLDYLAWAGILQMHRHYKANAKNPPRCLGTWQNCCGFKFEMIWLPILCHDIRQMHSDLIGSIENYADWYQTVSFRGFMLPTNYAWREPRPGQ